MAEYYRCYKEIDLDIIEKNFDNLKALTKENVKAMAVVKADAYGHGATQVAKKLKDKADFFAVATARVIPISLSRLKVGLSSSKNSYSKTPFSI